MRLNCLMKKTLFIIVYTKMFLGKVIDPSQMYESIGGPGLGAGKFSTTFGAGGRKVFPEAYDSFSGFLKSS